MFDANPPPHFSDMAIIGFVIMFGLCLIFASSVRAAYRNGVTDGYGYSKEPRCPGYEAAGRYLRKHMAHRWPELREDDDDEERILPWRPS